MRQSQITVLEDVPASPTPQRGSAPRSSIGGGSSIPLPSSMKKERVSFSFMSRYKQLKM